jgi:hypothetical protein
MGTRTVCDCTVTENGKDAMNALTTSTLLNARLTSEVCFCPVHRGTELQQIDGRLKHGIQIRIMLDVNGYHVIVGNPDIPENTPCPAGISQQEAEQILKEANK